MNIESLQSYFITSAESLPAFIETISKLFLVKRDNRKQRRVEKIYKSHVAPSQEQKGSTDQSLMITFY